MVQGSRQQNGFMHCALVHSGVSTWEARKGLRTVKLSRMGCEPRAQRRKGAGMLHASRPQKIAGAAGISPGWPRLVQVQTSSGAVPRSAPRCSSHAAEPQSRRSANCGGTAGSTRRTAPQPSPRAPPDRAAEHSHANRRSRIDQPQPRSHHPGQYRYRTPRPAGNAHQWIRAECRHRRGYPSWRRRHPHPNRRRPQRPEKYGPQPWRCPGYRR